MIRIINGITDIDCGGDCFIAKLCPTLDTLWTVCSLPESSVHGIFQQRILERITIPFSRGSSQPRDWTQVSHIAGGFFTDQATREDIFFGLCQEACRILVPWSGIKLRAPEMKAQVLITGPPGNSLTLTIHHKIFEKKYKAGNSSSRSFHINVHILLLFSHHSCLHEFRCPHPPVYPCWLYKPGLVEETLVIPFNSVEAL